MLAADCVCDVFVTHTLLFAVLHKHTAMIWMIYTTVLDDGKAKSSSQFSCEKGRLLSPLSLPCPLQLPAAGAAACAQAEESVNVC